MCSSFWGFRTINLTKIHNKYKKGTTNGCPGSSNHIIWYDDEWSGTHPEEDRRMVPGLRFGAWTKKLPASWWSPWNLMISTPCIREPVYWAYVY